MSKLYLLTLTLGLAGGQEFPVRFPDRPIPTPMPGPVPGSGTLTADQYYVIDSDVDGFLVIHPSGLVTVSQEPGPIKIRGKFVDGTGRTETRTYKGKTVFTVEAVGTGKAYIDFIPVGARGPMDVLSRTVDVDSGQGPQPPPGPKPPDPPTPPNPPTPPAPIPGDGLRVLVVYETADLTRMAPPQVSILTAGRAVNYLNQKCVTGPDGRTKEWRFYDQNADVSRDFPVWQNAMARAKAGMAAWKPSPDGKGPQTALPWMIVSNGKTGYEGPLSSNVDDFLARVGQYAP